MTVTKTIRLTGTNVGLSDIAITANGTKGKLVDMINVDVNLAGKAKLGVFQTNDNYTYFVTLSPLDFNQDYFSGRYAYNTINYVNSLPTDDVYGEPWLVVMESDVFYQSHILNFDTKQMLLGNYHGDSNYFSCTIGFWLRTKSGWTPYAYGIGRGHNGNTTNMGLRLYEIAQFPKNTEFPDYDKTISSYARWGYCGLDNHASGSRSNYHIFGTSLFGNTTVPSLNPNKALVTEGSLYRNNSLRYNKSNMDSIFTNKGVGNYIANNASPQYTSTGGTVSYMTAFNWAISKGLYASNWSRNQRIIASPNQWNPNNYDQEFFVYYTKDTKYKDYPKTIFTDRIKMFSPDTLPLNDKYEVMYASETSGKVDVMKCQNYLSNPKGIFV